MRILLFLFLAGAASAVEFRDALLTGGTATQIRIGTGTGSVLITGTGGTLFANGTALGSGGASTGTASVVIAGGTINNVTIAGTMTGGTASGLTLASGTTTLAGVLSGGTIARSLLLTGTASGLTLAGGTTTLAGVLTGGTLGNLNLTGTLTTSSGTFGPVFANGNIGLRDGSGGFMAINTNLAFTQFATGYGSTAFSVPSGFQFRWANNATYYTSGSQDTTISRQGAGVVQFGTTAVGSAGSIALTNITAGGFIQISGAMPAGNPTTGYFIGVGTNGALQAKGTAGTITTLATP